MLKKFGELSTVKIGLGVFVISYFTMVFVNNVYLFGVVLLGVSFGAISTRGILSGFLSKSVPPSEQGKIMGLSSSIDSISQIVGPLLGGLFLTAFSPIYFGLLPSILSLIGFLIIFKKLKLNYSQPVVPLEENPTRIVSVQDPCLENAAACIDE
jgi:DHA1 family tetracycline resistance protein-like MFS transporter